MRSGNEVGGVGTVASCSDEIMWKREEEFDRSSKQGSHMRSPFRN